MPAKTIGFDRNLELRWLDLTAGLAATGQSLDEIRQQLHQQLTDDLPGYKARRNTITVLTGIWVRLPEKHASLQAEAFALLPCVTPQERLWLHWGMTLLAYPFFHDIAAVAGRLMRLQGDFDTLQVRRRMRESWGQRTTLDRAVGRVIQSFAAWGVIQSLPDQTNTFRAAPCLTTERADLAVWFLECLLRSNQQSKQSANGQMPLVELLQSPSAFPFDLMPYHWQLRQSERFQIERQGLDLEMISFYLKGK
jgi:hypothetical protein